MSVIKEMWVWYKGNKSVFDKKEKNETLKWTMPGFRMPFYKIRKQASSLIKRLAHCRPSVSNV